MEIKSIDGKHVDILEMRLKAGGYIKYQDGYWCLFRKDGEQICYGKTIKEMLRELFFFDKFKEE